MTFESSRPTRWLHRIGAALLCAAAGMAGSAFAGNGAIVLDAATGNVVEAVRPDELDHPASLTKMMTLYLAFQALKSGRLALDQRLPVSAHAANKAPTKLGLRAGQTISVRDCILGMITKSANDAATVVAEKLGGSESRFVDAMNAQALLLGLNRTHFGSASGLPGSDDATTARDMGRLALALYRDFPRRSKLFATTQFTFRGHPVRGHNRLMARYPGMDGLKTGFTDAAGFNLASTAVKDGRRLFGVVLGGRTAALRDDLMARLLDDSFAHRNTPAFLVAQASMPDRSMSHRLLESLSPISTADARAVPVLASTRHVRHRWHGATRVASVHRRSRTTTARETRLVVARSSRTGHHAATRSGARETRVASARRHARTPVRNGTRLAYEKPASSKLRSTSRHRAPHRRRSRRPQLAAHEKRSHRTPLLASRSMPAPSTHATTAVSRQRD